MENLDLQDLTLNELKNEIAFIDQYSDLKRGEFAMTEDGLISAEDFRLSNTYKNSVRSLYESKIKKQRKTIFKLIKTDNKRNL